MAPLLYVTGKIKSPVLDKGCMLGAVSAQRLLWLWVGGIVKDFVHPHWRGCRMLLHHNSGVLPPHSAGANDSMSRGGTKPSSTQTLLLARAGDSEPANLLTVKVLDWAASIGPLSASLGSQRQWPTCYAPGPQWTFAVWPSSHLISTLILLSQAELVAWFP